MSEGIPQPIIQLNFFLSEGGTKEMVVILDSGKEGDHESRESRVVEVPNRHLLITSRPEEPLFPRGIQPKPSFKLIISPILKAAL